jgi:hypothetical protein
MKGITVFAPIHLQYTLLENQPSRCLGGKETDPTDKRENDKNFNPKRWFAMHQYFRISSLKEFSASSRGTLLMILPSLKITAYLSVPVIPK